MKALGDLTMTTTSMLMRIFGPNGAEFTNDNLDELAVIKRPGAYRSFTAIDEFLSYPLHGSTHLYDDVAQLCGGAGDTAALLVRREYKEGPNFDLVAGIDLISRHAMEQVVRYAHVHKPRIFIMSTPCTGMKGS